jgi:DNA-binding beta-propeller fold protein YncE
MKSWKLASLMLALATSTAAIADDEPRPSLFYTMTSSVTLPSGPPDWDYLRLDQDTGRLFIARRTDGLTVYDIETGKAVHQMADGLGANGPLTLTDHNRGYVAMTDGSALIFDLKTLATIARVRLDPEGGGMNGAVYDPASRRVIVVTGRRPKTSSWFVLDAASGKLLRRKDFDAIKMDDPAPDGKGSLYAPIRDQHMILKLRSGDLSEEKRFDTGPCEQPIAVEYVRKSDHLLIACRGDKPVFVAMDPKDGRILAAVPIGRGVDGMAIDEARDRIVTSNGIDATLSVIGFGESGYRPLGTVSTQPNARTMQIDHKTGRLFLVAADCTINFNNTKEPPVPACHPGSFRVLTYTPY